MALRMATITSKWLDVYWFNVKDHFTPVVIDIIRSYEIHAKNCNTIQILEAIIFKMESKMVEVPLTL